MLVLSAKTGTDTTPDQQGAGEGDASSGMIQKGAQGKAFSNLRILSQKQYVHAIWR